MNIEEHIIDHEILGIHWAKVADEVYFDNSGTDIVSDDVQNAIEKVNLRTLKTFVFESYFECDKSGSEYAYRTRSLGGSGSFEFNFAISKEADVIEEILLQGIVTACPSTATHNFTVVNTNYAKHGEAPNANGENNVTLGVALEANSGTNDKMIYVNMYKSDTGNTLFQDVASEDSCGFDLKQPANVSIEWMRIVVRWRKTSF